MKNKVLGLIFPLPLLLAVCALARLSAGRAPSQIPWLNPCSQPSELAFDLEAAAQFPFKIDAPADHSPSLAPGGIQAARELASALQPTGTICEYSISAETQAVIEQAGSLVSVGKKDEAQNLLLQHLQEITETVSRGHLVILRFQTSDWRGVVRDILGMAAAAYDAGGDLQPYQDAIDRVIRLHAGQELASADLLQSLRIEGEANLFGLDDLADQARQRAQQIAAEMIDAALADFDPCRADREAVIQLLNTAAKATLLGVEGMEPDEARFEAVKAKAQRALAQQWNAYVRQKGLSTDLLEDVPPCQVAGHLEVRIFSVCSRSWVTAGRIDFEEVAGTDPPQLTGSGSIDYRDQAVIGDELDCTLSVHAEVSLSGKLMNQAGVRSVEFTPSFSDDGRYTITGRTTPIHDEGVYPFNGYGAFVMPWVDGSVHPAFADTIIQYVLHISQEGE